MRSRVRAYLAGRRSRADARRRRRRLRRQLEHHEPTSTSGAPGAAPPAPRRPAPAPPARARSPRRTVGAERQPHGRHRRRRSSTSASPRRRRAPAEASTQISQALSVMRPAARPVASGCITRPLPSGPPGSRSTSPWAPPNSAGTWCPGTYTARVEVLARPKCGTGMMCPQFIRVVAILGPVTFRIAG